MNRVAKKKSKYGISWPTHPLTGQFIPPEEYKEVVKQLKAVEEAKKQAIIDAKENVQVYRVLEGLYTADALDQAIIEWKETKNEEDFADNAMYHIKYLSKGFAKQFILKLSNTARCIYMDCINEFDHTEWFNDILVKAINDWNPELQKTL